MTFELVLGFQANTVAAAVETVAKAASTKRIELIRQKNFSIAQLIATVMPRPFYVFSARVVVQAVRSCPILGRLSLGSRQSTLKADFTRPNTWST